MKAMVLNGASAHIGIQVAEYWDCKDVVFQNAMHRSLMKKQTDNTCNYLPRFIDIGLNRTRGGKGHDYYLGYKKI